MVICLHNRNDDVSRFQLSSGDPIFRPPVWSLHKDAIIRITRYLKDTQEKGLILSPTRKLRVNCYVDYD